MWLASSRSIRFSRALSSHIMLLAESEDLAIAFVLRQLSVTLSVTDPEFCKMFWGTFLGSAPVRDGTMKVPLICKTCVL